MRIAIDLTALADNFSGIERYAANMSRALLEVDRDDEFVLLFKDAVHDSLREFLDASNVEIRIAPSRGVSKLVFSQVVLPSVLARFRVDIALFLAFPAPLLYGGASVSTVHDLSCLDCPQTMTGKSKLLWRKLNAKATASPHGIITISEFSKSRIVGHYEVDPNSVFVVYCGVDRALFNPERAKAITKTELISKYGLPEKYILSLCTVEPRKNLSALIDAWGRLRTEGLIDADLVLAGRRGWKTEGLIGCCPENVRRHLAFSGFVDDVDLPSLYAHSELFVFPSIYEGFGLPPIEAVCSGARVLCSDIPCLRETCGDAVSYFNIENTAELRETLLKMDEDKSVFQVSSARLPREYNWLNEAKKLAEKALNREFS